MLICSAQILARGLSASESSTFKWQAKCHVQRVRGASNPEAIDHEDACRTLRSDHAGAPVAGGGAARGPGGIGGYGLSPGASAVPTAILLTTDCAPSCTRVRHTPTHAAERCDAVRVRRDAQELRVIPPKMDDFSMFDPPKDSFSGTEFF